MADQNQKPARVAQDQFRAQALVKGDRYRDLDRRQQWFDCTQHDWKAYDFDARAVPKLTSAFTTQQPLLTTEVAPFLVPLRQRRPSSPVRIGKIIVDAFTNLVFGEDRWPRFLCAGDADTQDYAEALEKEQGLRLKMIEARNLGGAVGTVGLSWCFREGKPRTEVHNAKNLYVHEWRDREQLKPAKITEAYLYPVDEYDDEKKKVVRNLYWYRRDWTADEDIAYVPVKHKAQEEPVFEVDEEASIEHGFGFAPFVWIQNTPSQLVDGLPDYHGQYEAMDTLDIIASVLARGTILNLDPTTVLKMDPSVWQRTGLRKGSDNALAVGENGDAHYMELAGTGIEAGIKLFELKRRSTLEACQCVVPDPNEVAASGTSSVAIKAIYQPMLGRGAVLREQYGKGIKALLEQQLAVARERHEQVIQVTVPADLEEDRPEETTEDVVQYVDLPPKITDVPKLDQDGIETGESETKEEERKPGEGEQIELGWGEWFPLTPQDRQLAVQALQLAAGAKPVLSQQTAVEEAATIFNRNPNEEWSRIQTAAKVDEEKQADMFPGAAGGGIAIGPDGKLKPAGSPKPGKPGKGPPDPENPIAEGPPVKKAKPNPFA